MARTTRDVIDPRVLTDRGDDADWQGDGDRDYQRQQAQLERRRQPRFQLGAHAAPAENRSAEVAPDEVGDPVAVLDEDTVVEGVLCFELFADRGINVAEVAEDLVHDIAGQEAHREEDDDGDPKEGGNEEQGPADEVVRHDASPRFLYRPTTRRRWKSSREAGPGPRRRARQGAAQAVARDSYSSNRSGGNSSAALSELVRTT